LSSQQIRSAIVKDKTLSTYSHNIKIITQNGKVTLQLVVQDIEKRRRRSSRKGKGHDQKRQEAHEV